jgi:hypothetical protein
MKKSTSHRGFFAPKIEVSSFFHYLSFDWAARFTSKSKPTARNKLNVWKEMVFDDRREMLVDNLITLKTFNMFNVRNFAIVVLDT